MCVCVFFRHRHKTVLLFLVKKPEVIFSPIQFGKFDKWTLLILKLWFQIPHESTGYFFFLNLLYIRPLFRI